ncbi:heterokaryon incompatibility protein-domain-containing protein [Fusarium oxysporum]|nr:heterokaryon incompatibility protein-domain-containing protein [Fusarium oxysporum]
MDLVEGYLCDTCISALRGKNKIKDHSSHGSHSLSDYHHQKYDDFVVSKDKNCFVCTWLWNKLPILPDSDPSKIDGFRIYRTVDRPNLKFLAVCPWAMNVVLEAGAPCLRRFGLCLMLNPGLILTIIWERTDLFVRSKPGFHHVKQGMNIVFHGPRVQGNISLPVIDVDRVEDGTVYLRERSEVKTEFLSELHKADDLRRGYPAYWTLSHRWGDPELIQQLSQSTENRLRSGMGVSDLSPTFRDAYLLVRRMGYRYIWVDSLCIFQDSLSEWQQEAKAMVDVYRHSFCNISAIGASSNPSSIGLFSKRRLPSRLLFPFKVQGQHLDDERGFRVGPWVFFNDSIWTDDVASTPLSTRGWVVQERFLAPRVLHFTENQIYWECLETTVCEADPSGELQILAKNWHLRPPIQTVHKAAGREIARSLSKGLSGQQYITRDEETAYLNLWGDVVSIYANCALTNESDRLIAMSGIAKTFQEANKDTYLAGLWKKVIHSDLTWKTDASGGAEVFRGDSSGIPVSLISLAAKRIVSEPPGVDSTGLLRSSELDIECMLYYYRWMSQSTTLAVFKDEVRHDCYFRKEFGSQHLHLDTADMVRKFKEMAEVEGVCVPLCGGYGGYGGGTNVFIMLEHVSGTTFRRIGTFEHGEIGRWISEWYGSGTRITLV